MWISDMPIGLLAANCNIMILRLVYLHQTQKEKKENLISQVYGKGLVKLNQDIR